MLVSTRYRPNVRPSIRSETGRADVGRSFCGTDAGDLAGSVITGGLMRGSGAGGSGKLFRVSPAKGGGGGATIGGEGEGEGAADGRAFRVSPAKGGAGGAATGAGCFGGSGAAGATGFAGLSFFRALARNAWRLSRGAESLGPSRSGWRPFDGSPTGSASSTIFFDDARR